MKEERNSSKRAIMKDFKVDVYMPAMRNIDVIALAI